MVSKEDYLAVARQNAKNPVWLWILGVLNGETPIFKMYRLLYIITISILFETLAIVGVLQVQLNGGISALLGSWLHFLFYLCIPLIVIPLILIIILSTHGILRLRRIAKQLNVDVESVIDMMIQWDKFI